MVSDINFKINMKDPMATGKKETKRGEDLVRKDVRRKNVLLISPSSHENMADVKWLSPPLGIVRMAGWLKKFGHHAEWMDTNFELVVNKNPKAFEEKLKEREWDIVGISMLEDTLVQDMKHAYVAKEICPKALIVAGGIEAQFNYQTILDKTPCKVGILGEGEIPMLMMAEEYPLGDIPGIVLRKNARFLDTDTFYEATNCIDWENIPYEKYWDYYMEKYKGDINEERLDQIHTIRIFTRNRCPAECHFCSSTNQLTWAADEGYVPTIDIMADTDIVHLIQRIKKAHPRVRTIYFTDDDFCLNPSKVIEFCKNSIKANLGLKYIAFSRITDINEEVAEWMGKAKFRVLNIGVESFSTRVLREFNKKYKQENIAEKLNLLKKHGINPFISLILVSPNSTLDDVEATVDGTLSFIEDGSISASIALACMPLHGTMFHEMYYDYMTRVIPIPGTKHMIKRNYSILANDPFTREAQLRFFHGIEDEIQREIVSQGIIPTSANQAVARLKFMKKIISDIRQKHSLPKGYDYKEYMTNGHSDYNILMAAHALDGRKIDRFQGV